MKQEALWMKPRKGRMIVEKNRENMPENMSISADETKHQRETAPKALDMNKETSEDD